MRRPTPFVALAFGALLAACAAPAERSESERNATRIGIDGVTIRNELAYPVTDVMIEVPATGSFAGCGTVLPRTDCSNRFQQIDYRAHPIQVHWSEHGQRHGTAEFVLELPADVRADRPARVEVTIFAPGQAGARLVQP